VGISGHTKLPLSCIVCVTSLKILGVRLYALRVGRAQGMCDSISQHTDTLPVLITWCTPSSSPACYILTSTNFNLSHNVESAHDNVLVSCNGCRTADHHWRPLTHWLKSSLTVATDITSNITSQRRLRRPHLLVRRDKSYLSAAGCLLLWPVCTCRATNRSWHESWPIIKI